MRLQGWLVVLALALGLAACGGKEEEESDPEPTRCGGVHWVDAASRDGYTGCQGNAGDWTCECGVETSAAFQGSTEVSVGGSTCGGAVREACSTSVELVQPCAAVSGGSGMCWYVEGAGGEVAEDTFDCRCERGTAPSETTGDSCLAVMNDYCEG